MRRERESVCVAGLTDSLPSDQKGLEPLFCTFDLNTNLNDHTRPEVRVRTCMYASVDTALVDYPF